MSWHHRWGRREREIAVNTQSPIPRLSVQFNSQDQLIQEYTSRLRKGVVIAQGGDHLTIGDPCEVVLLHPGTGHMLPLRVRVTSTNLSQRIVCQFEEFSPEIDAVIRNFVNLQPTSQPPPPAVQQPTTDVQQPPAAAQQPPSADRLTDAEASSGEQVDYTVEADGDEISEDDRKDPHLIRTGMPANVHDRLRRLPLHEIYKIARSGQLDERVALERIYGKTVWEPLLQNPNLTPPEVARISRMGTLPKPLIDTIVSRAGWLTKPLIRRALLSNPRLDGRSLTKVLRALPKNELVLVTSQTAYPYKVREAAKRLLGR